MMNRLHRLSATLIGLFVLAHLTNQALIVTGVQQHITLMETMRGVYCFAAVESLLLACVAFQIGSGVYLFMRRRRERVGRLEHAQAASGAVLATLLVLGFAGVLYSENR